MRELKLFMQLDKMNEAIKLYTIQFTSGMRRSVIYALEVFVSREPFHPDRRRP